MSNIYLRHIDLDKGNVDVYNLVPNLEGIRHFKLATLQEMKKEDCFCFYCQFISPRQRAKVMERNSSIYNICKNSVSINSYFPETVSVDSINNISKSYVTEGREAKFNKIIFEYSMGFYNDRNMTDVVNYSQEFSGHYEKRKHILLLEKIPLIEPSFDDLDEYFEHARLALNIPDVLYVLNLLENNKSINLKYLSNHILDEIFKKYNLFSIQLIESICLERWEELIKYGIIDGIEQEKDSELAKRIILAKNNLSY